MGYLMLPDGIPDFNKAVISLWFRVPQASIDAATAEYRAVVDEGATRAPLTGIIPLLTFGPPSKGPGVDFVPVAIGTFPQTAAWEWRDGFACSIADWVLVGSIQPAGPVAPDQFVLNDTLYDFDPSYIGIDCTGDKPAFSVHIVMPAANTPTTMAGSLSPNTAYSNTAIGIPTYSGGGACPGAPNYYSSPFFGFEMSTVTNPPAGFDSVFTATYTYGGPAALMQTRPEMFRLLPFDRVQDIGGTSFAGDYADQSYGGQIVTADQWHHVVLSFDLTDPCITTGGHTFEVLHTDNMTGATITDSLTGVLAAPGTAGARTSSACRMWVAFDDVNRTAGDLSCYWPEGYDDQNAILTVSGYSTAYDNVYDVSNREADINGRDVTTAGVYETPSYEFQPAPVSSHGQPLGTPAAAAYVNGVKNVELAEFLLFTGVTLDTGVEANRRLFITAKGEPVNLSPTYIPIDKEAIGDPATWEPGADAPAFVPPLSALDPSATGSGNRQLGMPVVDFTKCSFNWMMGRNLGSATGKTVKAGKIKAYMPDPKLGS